MPGPSKRPPEAVKSASPSTAVAGPTPVSGQGRGNAAAQDALRTKAAAPPTVADLTARLRAIEAAIATEDGVSDDRPRKPAKEQVASQLDGPLTEARRAAGVKTKGGSGPDEAARAPLEAAVGALETAWRSSLLYSTDAKATGVWKADATRDQLGSATVAGRIAEWQAQGPLHAVKFAVLPPGPHGETVVRVGMGVSHVAIAWGPVVAAGLLRFDLSGARPVVTELENVSGGFRPSPLRNAVAREALIAAGYTPGAGDARVLRTHDKADGNYGGSFMESE